MRARRVWLVAGVEACGGSVAGASDLTIHLKGSEPVKRTTVRYQCDGEGAKLGLPAGVFEVEYLNGAGNHLAVVPVKRNSMVFVTVPSASGAKYAADVFTWWEAGGRGTTFSSDFPGMKGASQCRVVK